MLLQRIIIKLSLITLFCFFTTCIFAQEKKFSFGMRPNLGLTFTSISERNNETESLEWLLNIQSNLNYLGKNFHFDSDLFLNYGQLIQKGSQTIKTQDALIFNLVPSIKLFEKPKLRLFLQTKAETQLTKGHLDNQETHFFDPGFLTHTLFVGEKNNLIKTTDTQEFKVTYGIGYSFMQIYKKHFVLTSEIVPSSDPEYISGTSAVFNFNFSKQLKDNFNLNLSLNSLFLMKKGFLKSTGNSRFSSLLLGSIGYKFISLQYTNRLVFDKAISFKRQLNQSLVIGIMLNI
jgi:hypothetical protein